ncbi:YjbH domain-containing protein [Paracoccaceae bacterium]|nr:YjbH domain-containing protein [Paracoccaceae bacterium]
MHNTYGMPGSIDTPSAEVFPEGQFSVSSSIFGGTIRTNLSFQVTNGLTVSFRYARIPSATGDHRGYFWDRSFDIHYLFNEQKKYLPSIAIGLRDFIGTGLYTGEYLVATKNITNNIKLSGGLGWGRLSGTNNISNIFGIGNERVTYSSGFGGTIHSNHFFSGSNSPFFSLSYSLSPRLELIAEMSSDDYAMEVSTSRGFTHRSDINYAFKYEMAQGFSIMGKLMHGNAIGLSGVLAINPRNSPFKSGIEPAPMPLLEDKTITETQSFMNNDIFSRSAELLELDGIILLSLNIDNKFVDVEILNRNYLNVSQMIGRVARILSKTVPLSVNFFRINIVDYQSSYSVSQIIVERESLREFELMFDGPSKLWNKVKVENSSAGINPSLALSDSSLTWSFFPDVDIMLFDPHFPINGSLGWEAALSYRIRNSTTINSSVKQPILTLLNDIKRGPKSGLPNVRSDFMYYYRDISTRPYISSLTIDQHYKPFTNFYTQINFGYLEMMYAGIRAEAIWKDAKKPYGIGLDIAAVRKRNTFGDFSILSESYSTIIGTVYYNLERDWGVQLDAGRYLAGDYGATLSLARKFNNGWEIGAYATLTDVKFSTFGEGSFDKGITLKVPLSWFTGKKSQAIRQTVIKPITGDGGARLHLDDDKFLYSNIAKYDEKAFLDNWKRVFR